MFDSLEEFESWFDIPKYLQSHDDEGEQMSACPLEENGELIKALIEGLHCVLKPFLLRRCKLQVLSDLVPKTEYTLMIEPTKEQMDLFAQVMDSRTPLNNRVMQLRKICNHPILFKDDDAEDLKVSDLINAKYTNKLPLLLQLLEALLNDGHKVLIFSQMTRMLDILQDVLSPTYPLYRLDGTTPTEERNEMVKTQSQCQIFLLSTRAGGLGLNLFTFDTVIFYDSDWVPL